MEDSIAYEKSLRVGKPKCSSHRGNCSQKMEMRHDIKVSKKQVRRKVRHYNKKIALEGLY